MWSDGPWLRASTILWALQGNDLSMSQPSTLLGWFHKEECKSSGKKETSGHWPRPGARGWRQPGVSRHRASSYPFLMWRKANFSFLIAWPRTSNRWVRSLLKCLFCSPTTICTVKQGMATCTQGSFHPTDSGNWTTGSSRIGVGCTNPHGAVGTAPQKQTHC